MIFWRISVHTCPPILVARSIWLQSISISPLDSFVLVLLGNFSSTSTSCEEGYIFLECNQMPMLIMSDQRWHVSCNAPRPMCQVSFSYSLLLPCHLLAYCISSCHHVHCINMFSKLSFVRVPPFFPLSVLSPETLARARGMSEILFYKWPENVLGMG